MSKFDGMRFAEAVGAAVLGAAVYDRIGSNNDDADIEAVRKFQRALILARSGNGFTENISERYLSRLSALEQGDRIRYTKSVLQPSEKTFDEKMTGLVIYDHALQGDAEWKSTCALYNLGNIGIASGIINGGKGALEDLSNFFEEEIARDKREHEERKKTWFGRFRNLMRY